MVPDFWSLDKVWKADHVDEIHVALVQLYDPVSTVKNYLHGSKNTYHQEVPL